MIDASNLSWIKYWKASLIRMEDLYAYNSSRHVNSRSVGVNIGVWLNKSEQNWIIIPILGPSIKLLDVRDVFCSNSKDSVVVKMTHWITHHMRFNCINCTWTDTVWRDKQDVFHFRVILSLKRKLVAFSWWMKDCMWVKFNR